MRNLIVLVPDHCFPFTSQLIYVKEKETQSKVYC